MKVSIITPSHNSAEYIKETLESILSQTYDNWELLITDDASTDGTCDIIETYLMQDSRIKLFRLNAESGAAKARNNSIEHASGRFIAFCDSDDLWTTDKLEKQISFMLEKDIAFSFSPYHYINNEGKYLGTTKAREKVCYDDLLLTCDIGCLTAIYDTEKLGELFMPSLKRRQDYALWLKILRTVPFAYSYKEPLGYYRIHLGSISSNKIKAGWYVWKMYREVEKIPFFRSFSLIAQYAWNGFKKYRSLY